MRPPDRLNRAVLTVLGLLLVVLGGAGIAAGASAFGTSFAHSTIFDNAFARYVGLHGAWVWPLIAVTTILVALAALRWLGAQVGNERTGTLRISSESGHGTTTLRSSALSDAVVAELTSVRGVQAARARLLGDPSDGCLDIAITVAARVDLAELRARVETGVVRDARTALDDPDLPVTITYDVSTKPPARDL